MQPTDPDRDGIIVPVVTRAGAEPRDTGQTAGATRISGVSPQHTPATRLADVALATRVGHECGIEAGPLVLHLG